MSSPIRLGIIGAGAIGNLHLEVFKAIEGVNVAAITDSFLPLAEQRAGEHGIALVHPNPETLLADESIDAVVIAVPNKFHASLAIEALRSGKHVLLEKPMSIDSASAREIVAAKEQSGKILMMAHQMRWTGLARALKQEIDSGKLGRIYNAKTGWMRRKGIPGWGSWFTRMDESGGGPLIDIGVHMLDLTLYMMGNPKPISVYGSTYAEFGPNRQGIGDWGTPNWDGYYDVEDLATALIKFDNGATLSLDVSWAAHTAAISEEPFLHLMGTEAGASLIGSSGRMVSHANNIIVESSITPLDGEDSRLLLNKHFINCIQEGLEPITTAMSGYTNNRILDAIYESSRTGSEVKLVWE
ncbi:Inositol 2-dehydrogenase/D-chiro-inositol 3-dehydrogenase [Paenibacillus plantiphilus]|uniref:Inositol 2-dehydrogenase/D-chiro-inositol 3-dehydrogenase n=1 Tax=Paenibacillus plantiphilus TaxID=2905650 RepID=A0ABM9CLX9_9BACL|nr:Gfo/Idh/MocA family oxidoreductase [Paenibacillus plantiphilus]CAH1216716.1 Inositol 2-dehydrogenase/D-chiro-inositol 3-dehydrogenase [Paenibacillus plantiphilus]